MAIFLHSMQHDVQSFALRGMAGICARQGERQRSACEKDGASHCCGHGEAARVCGPMPPAANEPSSATPRVLPICRASLKLLDSRHRL